MIRAGNAGTFLFRCLAFIASLILVTVASASLSAQETDEPVPNDETLATDPDAAVATLTDEQVRRLLLERLEADKAEPVSQFNPADLAFALQATLTTLRERAAEVFGTMPLLPDVFQDSFGRIVAEAAPGEFGAFVITFLLAIAFGGVIEWLVRHRLAATGFFAFQPTESFIGRLRILLWRLAVALGLLTLFALSATGFYLLFADANQSFRATFVFYLLAAVIARLALSANWAYFAPATPEIRLPSFSNGDALTLSRTLTVTVAFGAFGFFTCSLFAVHGVVGDAHLLVLILTGTITIALLVFSILLNRQAITNDILAVGGVPGRARRIIARIWPFLQPLVLVIMWIGIVSAGLVGNTPLYGAGLTTIFLFLTIPSLEAALEREAVRTASDGHELLSAFYRTGRLALLVAVIIVFALTWRVNIWMLEGGGISTQIAHAALQVAGTLMVAYLLWNAVHIWIARRIREEEEEQARLAGVETTEMEIGGTGQSRLRTLLPLARLTFQITLGVITVMIVMSSMGIDIAPVLAGAGVVGLAVGFGSQTLVRDVVSGVFFLVDDAFRLGEYVDVGDVKGSVEKISLRSFQLRHHRGAVNTVPFGEIRVLKNYSRDWAIMKLRFRVSFDADLEKVRKIMKRVGQELMEHPEIGEDFLQPFKSQGVLEVDDYGFIVRAKFMSKPGKQFLIRRHAYMAVQQAFSEAGINFAKPEVRVIVEDEDDEDDHRLGSNKEYAAGAAAKIATAQRLQDPEAGAAQ
ncbi:MAG: mechanosensitive ion channel domain-containing protein [Pseudomonadota bacterium]